MLTPRQLAVATPGVATAPIYTAAAAVRTRIDAFTVTNYSAAAITFSVYAVPATNTAANTNALVLNRSIAAGQSARVLEAIGHWLEGGGSIHMLASAAGALTAVVSGVEQTTA